MHVDLDPTKAAHGGRMTEFILLTDGDDQHSKLGGSSKASHDSAKSRLAKPGVPNFHLTLLYVGDDSLGLNALERFVGGVDHFRLKPCSDSRASTRQCWTEVIEEVTGRVRVRTATTH